MKIEITSKALKQAIAQVGVVIHQRSMMPSLGILKMSAVDGKLTLSGTNLDMVIFRTVSATVIKEGMLAIDPNKIRSLLDNSDDLVTIEKEEAKNAVYAKIKFGKFNKKAVAFPVKDVPKYLTVEPSAEQVLLPGDVLASAIESVIKSVATEKSDKPTKGIGIDFTEERTMRFFATDGRRISCMMVAVESSVKNFTLMRETADALTRIVPEEAEVSLESNGEYVRFKWEGGEVRSKVHADPFPRVDPILNQVKGPELNWVKMDGASIKVPLALVSEVHHAHRIGIEASKTDIKLVGVDKGDEATDQVPRAAEGAEMPVIYINGIYALEAISSSPSADLSMASSPTMLALTSKDGAWVTVIAPLKNQ